MAEIFKDESGKDLSLNDVSLNTALESRSYLEFVDSFRKNEKSKACATCWKDEATGTYSNRQKFNMFFNQQIKKRVETDTLLQRQLTYLEIKAGAICNLKCRICGSHNSSRIAQEEAIYFNDPSRLASVEQSRWVQNRQIWDEFSSLALDQVHIMGGEPFLEKTHIAMLDTWIQEGRASEITLVYNSNGTILPSDRVEKFKHFKQVKINLSIDDVGRRFEYQRYPGKWEVILKNFEFYSKIDIPRLLVNVDVCWSLMNIYYFEEIVDFFEKSVLHLSNFMKSSIRDGRHFYTGETFSPKDLPLVHKEKFLAKLVEAEKNLPQYKELISHLKNYIGVHDSKNENLSSKVALLDRIRNQQFAQVFPEISFVLNKV